MVKVLDLGLARPLADMPTIERLTAPGVLLGTADYIAPEQIDTAHTADARRGRLWARGHAVLPPGRRAALSGVPVPHLARHNSARHKEEQAPSIHRRRPDAPAALASLLERMLAKDPAARPTDAGRGRRGLLPFTASADLVGLLARAGGSAALPRGRSIHPHRRPAVAASGRGRARWPDRGRGT